VFLNVWLITIISLSIFSSGTLLGIYIGVQIKGTEKLKLLINHFMFQNVLILLTSILFFMIPDKIIDINAKFVILTFSIGIYILLRLRNNPNNCENSICKDIRCDFTIAKLYCKVSYTLFLIGGLIAIIRVLSNSFHP
jgi:hypothetical protein